MKIYNNHDSSTGRMSFSKGNQIKLKVNNEWHKADYLGYEGASEYIASLLAPQTNIRKYMELVDYRLEEMSINDKTFNGCVSENFLKDNETLITADRLFKNNLGISVSEFLKNTSELKAQIQQFVNKVEEITKINGFGQYLTALLEWDSFILNEDRHFNNIAFVYDDEKETYKVSPLFDNGAGFLSDIREDYPLEKNYLGLIANVEAKPFSKSFEKQVSACQKLYGEQLILDSDIKIPSEAIDNLKDMYGDIVAKRIEGIYNQQIYLTDIPFKKGITAEYHEKTLAKETADDIKLKDDNDSHDDNSIDGR